MESRPREKRGLRHLGSLRLPSETGLEVGKEAEWGWPWPERQEIGSLFRGVWGMPEQRILEHLKIAGKSWLESLRETGTQLF